ncbi:MAG: aminoglycoside phosphotransferase family protein [Actinomycetota bacterium]|jgi:aminoglycoside phosphotransferase (APT) family kinase protein|nr:aminoglycoside phosphotransferase family protein [Actinomycetota bacterium]
MHPGEITLSVSQVRRIVREQFPQWQDLQVRPVAGSGTVNRIFRLGDQLSARFPLVVDDPDKVLEHLEIEADAARELSSKTRFPTPDPVAIGQPSADYPGPWAVYTWLRGTPASVVDLATSESFASEVAEFVSEVRGIPVQGRSFRGHGRGGDLRLHDEWMETCFEKSEGLPDVRRLEVVWSQMRELPREQPDLMTHGDVLPSNLLVENGGLVGVLDPGGLGPADPALDLMGTWSLFDDQRRNVVRNELTCSDLEWARGQAWAFEQVMGAAWYYAESNPTMSELGRRALDRILCTWAL